MGDLLNATSYLVDRRIELGDGDRVAIRSAGGQLTYAEVSAWVQAFQIGLLRLGVRAGDRVLFVCSDRPELAVGILGAIRAGAVAVPVSTMLTGAELAKLVVDSGAEVLVASPEFADSVQRAIQDAPALTTVVAVEGASVAPGLGQAVLAWEEVVVAGASVDAAATSPDWPALWLYTSGTTGTPKAAMHRHANLVAVCEGYAQDVLAIGPDDRCFSIAKLFFAYGLGNSLLFPFSVGASTVLEPRRPAPDLVRERLTTDRPTLFFAAPSFYATLASSALPADTFASVRRCVSAGEALPAPLYERFSTRYGIEILDGIGSTEALHIFASNRAGGVRPGTTGTAVAGYDLEIRDDRGRVVPDGRPGTLHVRGASIATGYWCRTDASRQVFQGEWLCTGDTYVRSPDGYLTCLGRTGDLLKAGGIWVSPAEVEGRLLQHTAVAQVAVVGVPDADGLDKPVAYVVPVPGAHVTEADLVAWCRSGLAHFKQPRAVVFLEDLPRTATGKVQRYRLRELVGERAQARSASIT